MIERLLDLRLHASKLTAFQPMMTMMSGGDAVLQQEAGKPEPQTVAVGSTSDLTTVLWLGVGKKRSFRTLTGLLCIYTTPTVCA